MLLQIDKQIQECENKPEFHILVQVTNIGLYIVLASCSKIHVVCVSYSTSKHGNSDLVLQLFKNCQ